MRRREVCAANSNAARASGTASACGSRCTLWACSSNSKRVIDGQMLSRTRRSNVKLKDFPVEVYAVEILRKIFAWRLLDVSRAQMSDATKLKADEDNLTLNASTSFMVVDLLLLAI